MSPLFVLTLVYSASVYFWEQNNSSCFVLVSGCLAVVFILISAFSLYDFSREADFKDDTTGIEVESFCDKSESAFTFFLSVIIPIFSLNQMGQISGFLCYWLLVGIVVALIVRTNTYRSNPVLVLLGFKYYEIKSESDTWLVISKNKIKTGDVLSGMRICSNLIVRRKGAGEKKND